MKVSLSEILFNSKSAGAQTAGVAQFKFCVHIVVVCCELNFPLHAQGEKRRKSLFITRNFPSTDYQLAIEYKDDCESVNCDC